MNQSSQFRKQVRKFRQKLGITQAELAKLAGVRRPTLGRFEQGKRNLSPAACQRLENAIAEAITQRRDVIAGRVRAKAGIKLMDHFEKKESGALDDPIVREIIESHQREIADLESRLQQSPVQGTESGGYRGLTEILAVLREKGEL